LPENTNPLRMIEEFEKSKRKTLRGRKMAAKKKGCAKVKG